MTIRIFLGDLAYDTVSLSTDANPLNIGYIAAYLKDKFKDEVEITLFKYIKSLESALYKEVAPDILALSNYCWCENISLEMFRLVKDRRRNTVCVWGGPNFPKSKGEQAQFLSQRIEVDIYVPLEGELGFSEIVSAYKKHRDFGASVTDVFRPGKIDGCITRQSNGELMFGKPLKRLKNLDEIPSPYLTGLLDEFFDGRLKPRIQTSRGCPFTCAFCVDGASDVNKVNKFSLERIKAELRYIAEHVPERSEALGISDLNFGMYSRDIEICQEIANLQKTTGYPSKIMTTTGKNSKEKIIQTIKILNSSMNLSMSVQSLDTEVLKNIRRENISLQKMLELGPSIKEAGLRTVAEVILGLPGDTYNSHVETLRNLINSGMDHVQVYTLMLLDGSELASPLEREKWGFNTKFRILPRDFVRLESRKVVLEVEEVVVGSKTLQFSEYIELRILAFLVLVWSHGVIFDAFQKFLRENEFDVFDLMLELLANVQTKEGTLSKLIFAYKTATNNELWESKADLIEHYQKENNYQRLINGDDGFNVIQVFHAKLIRECFDEFLNITKTTIIDMFEKEGVSEANCSKIEELYLYTKGLCYGGFDTSLETYDPNNKFTYDICGWLQDNTNKNLEQFKTRPRKVCFTRRPPAIKAIKNELKAYGETAQGYAQVVKRVQVSNLWREAVVNTEI